LYEYSYLPPDEFLNRYAGMTEASPTNDVWVPSNCENLPSEKNWIKEGKVSPVQNQSPCGSSYVFAAISALESAAAISYDTFPTKLSAQHVLECVKNMTGGESLGCGGGRPEWIWQYSNDQGGLVAESSYAPYSGGPTNKCYAGLARRKETTVLNWQKIQPGDEEALKCRVARNGPVVVGISLKNTSLRRYFTGIFDDPDGACTADNPINHALLVVGYGVEMTSSGQLMDYWLVQNSWGMIWGNLGTFKMARGANTCKIADDAVFPLLKPLANDSSVDGSQELKPISAPCFCGGQGEIVVSGSYKKSFCIVEFLQTYDDSKTSCLRNGMRLFKVESSQESDTLKSFKKSISLYVEGRNISGCAFVDAYSENPEIKQGDCNKAYFSVCEFVDSSGEFEDLVLKLDPLFCF
jgi:hypothetical protein